MALRFPVMAKFATPEDEWRAYLDGTHPWIHLGRRTFRHIPSSMWSLGLRPVESW